MKTKEACQLTYGTFRGGANAPATHVPVLCHIPVEDSTPISLGVLVRRGQRSIILDRFVEPRSEEFERELGLLVR